MADITLKISILSIKEILFFISYILRFYNRVYVRNVNNN